MAHERELREWDRTAALMSWVGRLTSAKFEPLKLNPVRLAAEAAAKPVKRAVPKEESDLAFAALGAALKQLTKRG